MADVERTRRILAIELLLKRIMTLQHEQDVARQTIADKDKLIERLVDVGDKLADSVSVWMKEYKPYSSLVQSINRNNMRAWDALMKELEGKG